MSGPDLCPKCKGLHYRNAPFIVRKSHPEFRHQRAVMAVYTSKPVEVDAVMTDGFTTPKRGPGRPRTITDMKAYKAAKAREYRAKAKNANS